MDCRTRVEVRGPGRRPGKKRWGPGPGWWQWSGSVNGRDTFWRPRTWGVRMRVSLASAAGQVVQRGTCRQPETTGQVAQGAVEAAPWLLAWCLKRPRSHNRRPRARLCEAIRAGEGRPCGQQHGQGQPTCTSPPRNPGCPHRPVQPQRHSPDCAWRWPRRSAAWPRRPWLSPAARVPCSCTWPAVRGEKEARRQVRAEAGQGCGTPHHGGSCTSPWVPLDHIY